VDRRSRHRSAVHPGRSLPRYVPSGRPQRGQEAVGEHSAAHRPRDFRRAYETFKKIHVALKKPSTQRGYEHILETHYLPVLKNKRMTGTTTHMLSAITDELIDTPSELHHAQAVSRMFFRWAKRRQYITINPLEGIQLAKSKRRQRILTDEELRKV
jgi:hypothetical protein